MEFLYLHSGDCANEDFVVFNKQSVKLLIKANTQ